MSDQPPIIVWFRNDLRIADNPALAHAADSGRPILPLFILDGELGGAAKWWLYGALEALDGALTRLGAPLVLRQGDPADIIPALAGEIGARTVAWNDRYEPDERGQEARLRTALKAQDIDIVSAPGNLLHRPGSILTKTGTPFHVFTPFWRALRTTDPGQPIAAPKLLHGLRAKIATDRLKSWQLEPTKPDWATGFDPVWTRGEAEAQRKLEAFLDHPVDDYVEERNRPDHPGTTQLSPHLHWGEISPRTIWCATLDHEAHGRRRNDTGAETFLSELGWREFSHQLLYHHPDLPDEPMRSEFQNFPWRKDRRLLTAWQRGRTGYPIVDAGMRQLWAIGWMHNRVRMIVASFLTKHLLQPWQDGAAWFMDTLVDADLAANSMNWQWVAGCGADAAPYFRIFNPILQGEKFDPEGNYIRQWVPELERRPVKWIHQPLAEDERCGDYPQAVVVHTEARARALDAFAQLRKSGRS